MKLRKKLIPFLVLTACLVLFCSMPVFAAELTEADVEAAVASQGKEAVTGNVFVWFLCAIAFLKVSQKIDSFLASLGINVGNTGGNMMAELDCRTEPDRFHAFPWWWRLPQSLFSRKCGCRRKLPIRRACRGSGKTGTKRSGQFRNRLYRTQQYRKHALPVIPEQRRRLCQSGHQQHCTGKLRSGRFHQGSRRTESLYFLYGHQSGRRFFL